MADKKFNIQFTADMDFKNLVTDINKLKQFLNTVQVPKDATKNFEQAFERISRSLGEFGVLASRPLDTLADTKELEKAWKKVIKDVTSIQSLYTNLDASQIFPKEVLSNIDKVNSALDKYNKKLAIARGSQEYSSKTKERDESLRAEETLRGELTRARQTEVKAKAKYEAQSSKWTDQVNKEYQQQQKAIQDAEQAYKDYQDTISKAQKTRQDLQAKGIITSSHIVSKKRIESVNQMEDSPEKSAALAEIAQAQQIVQQLSAQAKKSAEADYKGMINGAKEAAKSNQELHDALNKAEKEYKDAKDSVNGYETSLAKAENKTAQINDELRSMETKEATDEWAKLVKLIRDITGVDLSNLVQDTDKVTEALESYKTKEIEKMPKILDETAQEAKDLSGAMDKVSDGVRKTGEEARELTKAEQEIENLKNQVLQFFSITNAVQLFKRTVQSALDTVKELDAVMTETAVVTDFTIGDMWEKLPEYSAEATKLGASIRDLYGATTLYYQQGLQTEEAMSVGIETMKMARIAGMEAADATEAMTAALRGFNMEVNETNAVRVNDVYSELAAITAADTEQIATAMSKTASIAASANMEFETTAALLAQIIETTQEAPETAGTAMKTIIARFTEVKELFSEGMLTGEDSEGEEININKIDAALKTVGISLKDFLNGKKGIDDIFLELASKWDGLDLATQRYIATMAAGSRQQSRFIAMMSNYDRTMELVTAANNSAGASQEQFDKTLESMEAKLQKLKNAWDEFTMGLANNEILKFGVDLLTGFLETVNKLTDALSGGNGLVKSVISLVTVIGALKGGNALLSGLFGKENEQGAGFLGKFFNKKKEDGSTKSSENQNRKQGEKDGKAYMSGWNRALEQGKKGGLKAGIKGFFGETKEIWNEFSKDKQNQLTLDDMFAKQAEITPDWDFEQYEKIRYTFETEGFDAARDKFVELGGSIDIAGGKSKQFNVDLQSVGQASIAVGGALGLLSSLFQDLGIEKAVDACSIAATAFMGIGSAVSILTTLFPALGKVAIVAGGKIQIAGWTSQLAWWWIFLIIAAIAALTVGVIALAKAAKKASLAGQMEEAQKATAAATESAEAAKTAYDDLLNAQSEYSSLQETLENLTKGTDKWKQALIEANAQVLQLLSTYPQLAEFISRGENGQLVISEAGFEKLINDQQNALQRAQAAMVSSQMGETRVQAKMDEREFKQNFQVNFTYDESLDSWVDSYGKIYNSIPENYQIQQAQGSDSGFYYDQNLIDDLQFVLKSGDLSNEALAPLVDEYKLVGESTKDTIARLHELCLALNEYDAALLANQTQMQAQAEALLVAGADQAILDSEYNNSVVSGFAKRMTEDDYANIEQNFSKQMYTNKTNEDAGRKKYMEEELGLTSTGDELKDLQLIYKELAGLKSIEDIPEDIAQNSQALADQIGKMQAAEQQIDKMEGFQQKLNEVNKEDSIAAKSIASLMSGDASNLTLNELEQVGKLSDYAGVLGYADTETMAKDLGYTQKQLSELELEDQRAYAATQIVREEGQTDEEYQDKLDEWINNQGSFIINASVQMDIDSEQYKQQMQEAHEKASAILASKKINQGAYKNLAIETVQNLSEQVLLMSDTDAQAYVENFNSILEKSKLGESEKKQLESYLSNVDWSSMTEAVNAIDYMQSMGIDSSAIEKYWNVATDGAKTYISSLQEALNLSERMQKKVQDVVDIEERLNEGKGTYEDMMELSKAGVDISKFELTSEGWKATSEEIKDATEKLQEYNIEQARMVAMQQKETYKDFSQRWAVASKDTSGNSVLKEMTQGSLEDGLIAGDISNLSEAWQTKLANEIGYVREQEDTPEEFEAKLQEAYNNFIDQINNGENYNIITEKTTQMTEIGQYQSQIEQGETANLIANVNPDQQEALKKAIEETTKATSGAEAAMSIFIKDMSNEEKQAAKNNTTLQLLAIRHAKAATAVQNLEDKLNDNIDTLKKGPKAEDKYLKAIDEISIAAKDVFGDKATTDFVENNKKLFIQMQKGGVKGQEAFRKIRDKILEAKVEAGELSKNDLGAIKTVFNDLDGQNIEVGADFDATEAINSLLALGYTAEEVQKMMQDAGYAVEFETITHYIGQVTGTDYGPKVFQTIEGESVRAQQVVVGTATGTKVEDGGGFTPSNTGSSSSKSNWENPYDEFYNVVEDINEELRTREKLERRYQALLDKTGTKASDLVKNAQDQIKSLEKEKKLREGLLQGRNRQMSDIESEYSDLSKYAWYNEEDGTIEIDWEKIEALDGSTNEKLTSRIEEYITALEEQQDLIEEEEDSLDEIEETIREIRDQGKDEYFDLESQIKEALIGARQDEIDELSAINDSINDTNSRLIDAMQSSIDKYRQDRENEKTEEELADKQRRLAYLQQDTSGANALDIMQLQEEIDQAQEDYTDTLIDQKISELQQQNDEAAEQRQKQIDIMNDQLQHDIATGAIWDKVYELMGSGIDKDGIKVGSSLWELLKDQQEYPSKSNLEKLDWAENLRDLAAQAVQWLSVGNSTEALIASGDLQKGQKITFKTADGKTVEGKLQDNGDIIADGKTYKDVRRNYDGSFVTEENYQDKETKIATTTSTSTSTTNTNSTKTNKQTNKGKSKVNKFSFNGVNYSSKTAALEAINRWETDQISWAKIRWFQGEGNHSESYLDSRLKTIRTQASTYRNKLNLHKFKTGGLADFTGPAWLDGTKSKPEYILNADQTKAFFELVDVLSGLKSGVTTSSQINGDSIYDVDINVESIGSDYDVEQLAQTVKRMINDDARYRNNNAINLSR